MSVTLNGSGLGFPVTYQILFDNIHVYSADEETSSAAAARAFPWGMTVPTGYDLFIVAVDLDRFMSAPTTGYISAVLRNGETDDKFANMPAVRLSAGGAGYAFSSVSSGACRIPEGTPIVALLSMSNDFTHGWSSATVRMAIYGYLRQAVTE